MADTRSAKLILDIQTKGSDKSAKELADIGKSAKALDRDLSAIGKKNVLADSFKEADAALNQLTDDIRNDLRGELDSAAKSASSITAGGGGAGVPAAAKFRGAASLVGGGEIVGLLDDLQDLGEGVSQLGSGVTSSLVPALNSGASSALAAGAAMGVAAAALAVLALAIKSFADEQAKQAETINAIIDKQRSVAQDIAKGATSEELQQRITELNALRDDENQRLATLQANYQANIESQGALSGILKVTSGAEDALAGQIDTSTKNAKEYEAEIKAITDALDTGKTAANDAKLAEDELAKTREKEAQAILSRAAAAGSAIQAQNRALDASEAQNLDRLDAIEEEKQALAAQIAVLESSGNTTEAVTSEIAKLNAQLGALGDESSFISSTALEASRQRDAEQKAAKEAEQSSQKAAQEAERNAERAAAAQQKYNDTIAQSAITLKQATQDIDTKLGQTLADNLTGLFRDATDLATKYARDNADLEMKSSQEERDALIDHYRSIEDIRTDGAKSEQEAIREGDFKALYLARQNTADELAQEQKQQQREDADRRRALQDERADLLRNTQRERADRLTAYERQNSDARTAAGRELQQAQLARQRALEANSAAYAAELKQLGSYLTARQNMQAQANQQMLQQQAQQMGAAFNPYGINGSTNYSGQSFGIPVNQMLKKVMNK